MATLKLISLNIEGSKHLSLVLPFLKQENPDVVCLQELYESDIPVFSEALEASCTFAPMLKTLKEGERCVLGVGIFSKLPTENTGIEYFIDHQYETTPFDSTNSETKFITASFALVSVVAIKNEHQFPIFSTHFPVTDGGSVTTYQREALANFLTLISKHPSFVLCGDFNAPRGGEIFSVLAEKFTDNIPAHYTTSIDGAIHRAGNLPHMVDGLFTTKDMAAHDVRLQSGVSDHMAVIAYIN